MRSTAVPSALAAWFRVFGLSVLASIGVANTPAQTTIPRPEGIQPDVNFWIRVYTEVTPNERLLHDEPNRAVICDTVKFGAGQSPKDRQRLVDDRRDRHIASLRRIIA